MGQLARHLQDQFMARTPRGWSCDVEARVLDSRFERLLGYAPQADVLLASNDGLHRLKHNAKMDIKPTIDPLLHQLLSEFKQSLPVA